MLKSSKEITDITHLTNSVGYNFLGTYYAFSTRLKKASSQAGQCVFQSYLGSVTCSSVFPSIKWG